MVLVVVVLVGWFGFRVYRAYFGGRNSAVMKFILNPEKYQDWVTPQGQTCDGAPFSMPTEGYIGYYYDDSFRPLQRHQGIDIFGGKATGETPIFSPYDGFLSRQEGWKSSLIIRIPQDPTTAEPQQIWVYLTHLADLQGSSLIADKFPPSSLEIPVKKGDLLGYQGNYSGTPAQPVGVHLHLSIVMDDGKGHYLNELKIDNTYDPSPYFGMNLRASNPTVGLAKCETD
jgi:murein DD-endopeptidase MepM/ murein hydrolase activator NlpD